MPRLTRVALAAFALSLTAAPEALAIPLPCPPVCTGGATAPVATLSAPDTAVRTADAVTFNATGSSGGTDSNGNARAITKVEWDLDGNGTYEHDTGTTLTKSHTYPARFTLGGVTAKVRITSAGGTATATKIVQVANRLPIVSLAVDDTTPVTGQQITYTGSFQDTDSQWAMEMWQFNGQWCSIVSGNCPGLTYNRVFTEPGTYTQVFGAADAENGESSTSRTVTVRRAPVATVQGPQTAIIGEQVELDAGASTGTGIHKYLWDLDGNPDNGFEHDGGSSSKVTKTFTTGGNHKVRVKVYDVENVSAESAVKWVKAHQAPTADFTYAPANPKPGETITFESTASDDFGIVMHQWDLDGVADTFEHGSREGATATFPAGEHVVRLRVSDGDGGADWVEKTIVVAAPQQEKPAEEEQRPDTPADEIKKGGETKQTQGGSTPGAAASTGAAAAAAPAAIAEQRGVAPVKPAVKRKKAAKKRCATVKAKKGRGKKAKKRCATKKRKAAKRKRK